MQVNVEKQGDLVIMHLKGKLFLESLGNIVNEWEKIIAAGPGIIAVDCANLNSIDSSAIGTLVKFFNEAMGKNIELVFYDLNPSIRKLFRTIHLEKFIPVITAKKFETEYLKNP